MSLAFPRFDAIGDRPAGFLPQYRTSRTAPSTLALGFNDRGEVAADYMDSAGLTHGSVYTRGQFHSIDDPEGIGTTTVNGVNRFGQVMGFYVDTEGNTDGFVATP